MNIEIQMPEEVKYIIGKLAESGYEAYIVGGCVRDSLLGKEPQDWDICTPALPDKTIKCFEGHNIIETGLKHGTVTLILNREPFEITTFRVDGEYTDNRRPDKVQFVGSLKEDLSRRDFTINAMAYSPESGIVDFFGGREDLREGIIRCVGDSDKRFREDALRIMRALRFAASLGFTIERNTSKAMIDNRELLKNIASERIASELNKLITGKGVSKILLNHLTVITKIIPEISPMIGFQQNNPYHCHDVLNHTLLSVDNAPKDVYIRLTMLFHDIGKPHCYTEENGTGHFYGHQKISADMTKDILTRLKYDNKTVDIVTQLILYHDSDIQPRRKHLKRWLNKIGEERLRQLIEVKRADAAAQSASHLQKRLDNLNEITALINEIVQSNQCFSLKDLAINGKDLIAAGIKEGREVGIILNKLTDMVIDEETANEKEKLLEAVRGIGRDYGG